MPRFSLQRWTQKNRLPFAQLVALDLRSLGLFRIALGSLILIDLCLRAQDLVAHYTDSGVLPIDQVPIGNRFAYYLAPHFLANTPTEVGALFIVAGLAALALAIGFRTQWMIVLSWILLQSLQTRNPLINHAGDKILLLMLFWGFFLPLDRSFRLFPSASPTSESDKEKKTDSSLLVASWATAGALLQFASIYLMGAFRKSGATWWDGSAVWYTLQIDQYARPWTRALLDAPHFLRGVTWITLAIEWIAPILLFTGTGSLRRTGVILIMLLHIGFLTCLDLGLFPYISIALCVFAFPWVNRNQADSNPVTILPLDTRTRVAGYLTLALLIWNLATLRWYPEEIKETIPSPLRSAIEFVRLDQYWSMFAPNPMTFDGWYVITEADENADEGVNLLETSNPSIWEKPVAVAETFPSDRWKEYLMTLSDMGDPPQLWKNVVTHFSERYNRNAPSPVNVDRLRVVYMMEKSTVRGEAVPVPEQAWPKEDSF